jgi:hypothetical protein
MSIEIVKQLYPETYRAIALEAIYAYRKVAAEKRRKQPTKKAKETMSIEFEEVGK